AVGAAVRRSGRGAGQAEPARASEAGNALGPLLLTRPAGRVDRLDPALGASLAVLRDASQACEAQLRGSAASGDDADPGEAGAAQAALVALDEMAATADRMVAAFEPRIEEREEVVWLERPDDLTDTSRP